MPVPIRFYDESNDTLIVFNQFSPDDTLFLESFAVEGRPSFSPINISFSAANEIAV